MVSAIIVAAGKGRRMGCEKNKILLELEGIPLLLRSVNAMVAVPAVMEIIVVVSAIDHLEIEKLLFESNICKKWQIVIGGKERQDSVANALKVVDSRMDYILVHDAARPLVDVERVQAVIENARKYSAACLAVAVKDTIKIVDEEKFILDTPDRSVLWAMQTPQVFAADLLKQAYKILKKNEGNEVLVTDDAALVEKLGIKVKLIDGGYENIKITTPEDIAIAETFLRKAITKSVRAINRVGMGYDVHRLVEGRKLFLGGVEVPYAYGLEGHSDADVLLHALKDALLGAAALGDIGRHFPDTDKRYKGISSLLLLQNVYDKIKKNGLFVANVDITVVAQAPKLAPYIAEMQHNIAEILEISIGNVNVKATTTEKLGFAGRGEGIAAYAVAMLVG